MVVTKENMALILTREVVRNTTAPPTASVRETNVTTKSLLTIKRVLGKRRNHLASMVTS